MYLRNAWYVAAVSREVKYAPTPVQILGERIVLYRMQSGQVVALDDVCPHRRLPLSRGTLKNDALECGYHGLTFDCHGKCIRAPTQTQIPSTAKVHSYPVTERYGLVWIFMGDSKVAERMSVPRIENYDNPAWDITSGDFLDCKCNYLHLVDNLLDPSHVAWVHKSSFAASGTSDTSISVKIDDDRVIASRWIHDCEPPPFYENLLGSSRKLDRLQHYEMRIPSFAVNKSIFTAPGNGGENYTELVDDYIMISYNFLTPVDACNTRYFWLQHRNSQVGDESITATIAAGARAAFEEDRAILEAVHEGMENASTARVTLGIDAAAVQFRRVLNKRIDAENPER